MATFTDKFLEPPPSAEKPPAEKPPSTEFVKWDDIDTRIDVNILRGVTAYGFDDPSPIQQKTIIPLLEGHDVVGQAQSGTGKTAAFAVGLLSRLNTSKNTTQALVLSPTRELASQTTRVISSLGGMMNPALRVESAFGGVLADRNSETRSFLKVSPQPHVVCGCPGRIFDMLRRGSLNPDNLVIVVIDEADELLSRGFKDQMFNIFQHFQNNIQVALFSATLPPHMDEITNKIMRNPVTVRVESKQLTLEGISQFFVAVDDDQQKYATLKDVYSHISMSQCIIYCNSVKRVVDLYEAMVDDGFPVCHIHREMEMSERLKRFDDFRCGGSRVLISTNLTARGIDIQQVSTVINFDLPKDVSFYLHRIGRSGRWGRKGVALNFITRRDVPKIKEIEETFGCDIKECPGDLSLLHR